MTGVLEIEKRYELLECDVQEFLKKFTYKGTKELLDIYLDTSEGTYYQQGVFIRLRNQNRLDIKFNPDHLGTELVNDHVSCLEYSFQEPFSEEDLSTFECLEKLISLKLPSGKTFSSFMEYNTLKPFLVIDKIRKIYETHDYEIALDEIKDFGTLLEVEYRGQQEKSIEKVLFEIDHMMKDVSVKPLEIGGFEIILRKKNYNLYKKGKYILPEDREVA